MMPDSGLAPGCSGANGVEDGRNDADGKGSAQAEDESVLDGAKPVVTVGQNGNNFFHRSAQLHRLSYQSP